MTERRSYTRKELRLDVDVEADGQTTERRTLNLSMVGLFVEAGRSHPVGTRVVLSLRLPDGPEPLEVLSEVAHSIAGSGMGFKFLEFRGDARERLLAFLGPGTRIEK
jgi:hypothetical protein